MTVAPIDDTVTYSNGSGATQTALGVVILGGSEGGGGTGSVEVSNFPEVQPVSGPLSDAQLRATAVPVSGPLTNAQLTAITGTAVTTIPAAANQTMMAVLRGILSEMQAQTALLQTIATNTDPGTGV